MLLFLSTLSPDTDSNILSLLEYGKNLHAKCNGSSFQLYHTQQRVVAFFVLEITNAAERTTSELFKYAETSAKLLLELEHGF